MKANFTKGKEDLYARVPSIGTRSQVAIFSTPQFKNEQKMKDIISETYGGEMRAIKNQILIKTAIGGNKKVTRKDPMQ